MIFCPITVFCYNNFFYFNVLKVRYTWCLIVKVTLRNKKKINKKLSVFFSIYVNIKRKFKKSNVHTSIKVYKNLGSWLFSLIQLFFHSMKRQLYINNHWYQRVVIIFFLYYSNIQVIKKIIIFFVSFSLMKLVNDYLLVQRKLFSNFVCLINFCYDSHFNNHSTISVTWSFSEKTFGLWEYSSCLII